MRLLLTLAIGGASMALSIAGTVTDSRLNAAIGVTATGGYAYVASFLANALTIVDVSDPTSLSVVGSVSDSSLTFAESVAVNGSYAYVAANDSNALTIVDASDPTSPSVVGSVAGITSARGVAVAGSYAYVTANGSDTLAVVDVSNPASPSIVGSVTSTQLDGAMRVAVDGSYAFVTAFNVDRVTIVDISTPASPSIVGSVTSSDLAGPVGITVNGEYAYVAAESANALTIVNISDATSPSVSGSVTGIGAAWGVALSGSHAIVSAGSGDALTIVDVSDVANPVVVESTAASLDGAAGVTVSGEYAFVTASNADSLSSVGISAYVPASGPIIGQPDDRYRSNVAADAGSLLASQQAVPFDTSAGIAFGLGTNLDQKALYPLREATRDQDGSVTDVLFYPRARQGTGIRSYDGVTMLTLMERNYPPAIFDTTSNLGLGASATAQEIIAHVLGTWDTRYDWFSFKTVPDLRTRVDGLPAPSEYGTSDGLIADTVIAIRQDEDARQSMRQILDDLLSPFPGAIYYQDSEGDLVIRPAYGPDADENPVATFEDSDIVSISVGEPDALNITNQTTATTTRYTRQDEVETMQPAWFQIVSNHLMGDENLFTPQSNRLNLSGETTDDESTRQAESPDGSFSAENRPLSWPIQDGQILAGGGISLENADGDPTITAAYYGSQGQSGQVGNADITVTTIPLDGSSVDAIKVAAGEFDVTITGRWDAQNQQVILGLGNPMRLESGNVSWALEFTLNDSSVAYAPDATLSYTFGDLTDDHTLPAADGGNAIEDSQDAYGILEARIPIRGYGNLTTEHLEAIARGHVMENITPKATRELVLGAKGSTKALFDRRGRLVGLPDGGEGLLTGVHYADDFNARTVRKTVRVEETVAGAGAIGTTGLLMNVDGTYWQNIDGTFSEPA